MDWIHLAVNGDQWQGQVNMVMNLPVSLNAWNCPVDWGPVCCQLLRLYSVCDRWMNAWIWSIDGMILMGILKYPEKILSQLYCVCHKSNFGWPGINLGLHTIRLAAKCLSHTAFMESVLERAYIRMVLGRIFGTMRRSIRMMKIV